MPQKPNPTAETERSYYFGTHDAEIKRLGLQHRVWRPDVLNAWQRAGIAAGHKVIDAGAGPGYASLDLAEIVGKTGRVHALERSARFADSLNSTAISREIDNIDVHTLDLVTDPLPMENVDAVWIRWVFAFLSDPITVLEKLAHAIRPGGVIVIHEYIDWRTLNWSPRNPVLSRFVDITIDAWRASGGEPDIAARLLPSLPETGLKLKAAKPLIFAVQPDNDFWQWPLTFLQSHVHDLAASGTISSEFADDVIAELEDAPRDPACIMTTPLVMEIIAEKI